MENCFSRLVSDEPEQASSREESPVRLPQSVECLLHEFKQQMLKEENFKFDGNPLVKDHMSKDDRQTWGELYVVRPWPVAGEWLTRFNDKGTPFYNSMINSPEL
jgi:hypothetical protein